MARKPEIDAGRAAAKARQSAQVAAVAELAAVQVAAQAARSDAWESGRSDREAYQRSVTVQGEWRRAGLPRLHRERTETGWRGDWPIPRAEIDAALEAGGMVILTGNRGTGKTQIAAELIRDQIERHAITAKYTRADDLFESIKATFGDDDAPDPYKAINRVGLLVIDEIQDRYDTAFEDMALTRIIDKRYGEKRPTVLIANLQPRELWKRLGASITSRMTECGFVVECDWPSYRGTTPPPRPPGAST